MANTVTSINDIQIRLPDERWSHISTEHQELTDARTQVLDAIAHPDQILAGTKGELLAIKSWTRDKWLIVVYRENKQDGFIITAFLTSQKRIFGRRKQLWP